MENLTTMHHASGRAERNARSKQKPFVTILDGTIPSRFNPPGQSGFSRRKSKPARRSPAAGAVLRKSSIRLGSYARESLEAAGSAIAPLPGKILGRIRALPVTAAGRKSASTPLPPAEDARGSVLSASEDGAGQAQARPPVQRTKKPFARKIGISMSAMAKRAVSLVPKKPVSALALLLAIVSIAAGTGAIVSASRFPIGPNNLVLPDEDSAQRALLAFLEPEADARGDLPSGSLPPLPVSLKVQSYTVRAGDSLDRIARRFGLRQDTIISMNGLASQQSIRAGVQLRVPNMDGLNHKVRKGENLSSLTKAYGVDMTKIVDANDLSSGVINAGQTLFIPNARLSSSALRNFYGEKFIWPAKGRISSPFGYRANPFTGLRTYHSAIDIVMSRGTSVKATMDGTVADTGYNSVFGNYVILKHSEGYQSLYAHLDSVAAKEGSKVSQGTVIGKSGNTGQSTGPHLHFSIFRNGQALDPVKYVK